MKLSKTRSARLFNSWRKKEKGVAEIYSAIIILPVLMALILVLLETGFYIHYRSVADGILQDAVRGISLESGNYNPRTNALYQDPPAAADGAWTNRAEVLVEKLCLSNGKIPSSGEYPYFSGRCEKPPMFICSGARDSMNPNEGFNCTITFYYKTVSPLSTNKVMSMGMSGLFSKPITITIYGEVTGGA